MAFIRSERKGEEIYISICETVRLGGKVQQRRLHNLGKLSDYSEESLRRIGERLYALGGGNLEDLMKNHCEELARYNYGFPLILNYLFKAYNLEEFFQRIGRSHQLNYPFQEVVLLMLCNRWSEPLSKLGVYDTQRDFYGFPPISLHWLYRSLDKLAGLSTALQTHLHKENLKLLDYQLDVVYYDVTTFYFDSEVETENTLRQKGFSKDGKIGKTQLLLGLLLDKYRNPIGYELYSGDTYEGKTLKDGVLNLKKRYKLDKVVVVSDSGFLNETNLQAIHKEGYEFIIGERLKNLPKSVQESILDRSDYQVLSLPKSGRPNENISLWHKIVSYAGRKILCTYSEKRASKDRQERAEKIAKGKSLLKNPALLGRKASIYYLKTSYLDTETGEISSTKTSPKTHSFIYEIDEEKIRQAERYDGLKAIATSALTLSNEDILLKYKDLYQIEQAFRSFKSFLETRPMFHWTDERIKGHFCLCYLSFCLLNYLQKVLKDNDLVQSENDIRNLFSKMQVTHLQQNKHRYYLPAPLSETAKRVLKILKINKLNDLIPNEFKINDLY